MGVKLGPACQKKYIAWRVFEQDGAEQDIWKEDEVTGKHVEGDSLARGHKLVCIKIILLR
jgi:hypothetical protein